MNMDIFPFICIQLSSSVSYCFQSIGLSTPSLSLFLAIFLIVNETVFLISLSDGLLLLYRHATDFCILILYPETLLKSFISCNSFLVATLGFSTYSIMSSTNSDSFTPSLPIWIFSFLFLVCLLWIRLPEPCEKEGVRVGVLVLLLILEEKLSAFHHCI